MLLITDQLPRVQAAAASGTPQWQAFIKNVDALFARPVNASYEAGNVMKARDCALAWLATGLDKYGWEAIAILKLGVRDDIRGNWGTRIKIATGDGVTLTFPLPNTDVIPSSATAYLGADGQHAVGQTTAKFTASTVTFTVAPPLGQGVFVEYKYGTQQQQTGDGNGGLTNPLNSYQVDSGFASRFYGQMIEGISWLAGFSGLDPLLVAEIVAFVNAATTWVKAHGFGVGQPLNNYGAGDYFFITLAALWLGEISDPSGPALLQGQLDYRNNTLVPALATTGGNPPEGWGYGTLADENIGHATHDLIMAGLINGTSEIDWSTSLYDCLQAQLVTPTVPNDLGDRYNLLPPEPRLSTWLAVFGNGPFPVDTTAEDLLFRDPAAPPITPPVLPTWNDAGGMMVWRGQKTAPYCWAILNGTHAPIQGHGPCNAGHLGLKAVQADGTVVDLLVWGPTVQIPTGKLGSISTKSLLSNLLNFNYVGQVYPWNEGIWGPDGTTHSMSQAVDGTVTAAVDYTTSYVTNHGTNGVASATRQVVFTPPGKYTVTDHGSVKDIASQQRLQWHVPVQPTINPDNSWSFVVGTTRTDVRTTANVLLSVSVTPITVTGSGHTVTYYRVDVFPKMPTATVDYTTTISVSSTIHPPAPTASFVVGAPDYQITLLFDGSASSAPSGYKIVSWNWDFGDGHVTSSPFPQTSHSYTSTGSYTATLTVTDDNGDTSAPVVQQITI